MCIRDRVVPHLVRTRAGSRHRAVIAAAGLAGATLVILADLVARTLRAPSELPLGAVTASWCDTRALLLRRWMACRSRPRRGRSRLSWGLTGVARAHWSGLC